MATLSYNLGFQVGGVQMAVSETAEIEAFDKVEIKIDPPAAPAGGGGGAPAPTKVSIDIQPGATAKVLMLLVKSNFYHKNLTVEVDDGASQSPTLALSGPLVLLGDSLKLLGVDPPKTINLEYAFAAAPAVTKPATVEILVGRLAH